MEVRHVVGLSNGTGIPDVPTIEQDEYTTIYAGQDLLGNQDALLDAWLAIPAFTCCAMQTGYHITVDSNSPRYDALDHFWHMQGWFYALKHILAHDEAEVTTFVWDESSLTMQRQGAMLTMFDGHPKLDRYTFRPKTFPLRPFADLLVREGQYSVGLMRGQIDRLRARGCNPEKLMALVKPLGDLPHPAPEDLELKAAIIYRELYQPEYFAMVASAADLLAQMD